MDRKILVRNFSRYAHLYDAYSDIQRQIACELIEKIKKDNFSRILEIGCGTGNYTLLLQNKFRHSKIEALDISEKMLQIAKNKIKNQKINFIVADAEEFSSPDNFDLITSNACLQWFLGLEKALFRYKGMLNEEGSMAFSLFGPETFWELNSALKALDKEKSLAAEKFPSFASLQDMLKENFKEAKVSECTYQERFSDLRGLLKKIKYSGIRGSGLNGEFITASFLKKLEQIYLDKFKEIKSTYQVFFCRCQKN